MKNIISCSTFPYHRHTLDRALQGVSEAGYEYVELVAVAPLPPWHPYGIMDVAPPEKLSDSDISILKKKISDYGLQVSSISGHVDLYGETPELSDLALWALKKRIVLAKGLGASIVNTYSFWGKTEEQVNRFYGSMKDVAKCCAANNITVAVEPIGVAGEHLLKMMNRIKSRYVGVNYDPACQRMFLGLEFNLKDDLAKIANHVVHFHVCDHIKGNAFYNPAVGDGVIDFKALFDTLKEVDYKGPYSVEVEFDQVGLEPLETIDQAVKKSREYVEAIL